MNKPRILSGKVFTGSDFQCGENVVIDVAESICIGDRCVLGDNTYISGRRVTIGDDFYGYSWEWKRLDIGRGRSDDELAVLTVGDRCTFHDNRIDLAREVTIGDDVGLSPEVCIYTHYYWQSPLEGYPMKYAPVAICNGAIVGFRSTVLPGVSIGANCVIGAGSVITRSLQANSVCAGVPCEEKRCIRDVQTPPVVMCRLKGLLEEYSNSCRYRGWECTPVLNWPFVNVYTNYTFDFEKLTAPLFENEFTDDFRDFMFKHGIRFYTKRPFRKLPIQRLALPGRNINE